MKTFKSVYLDYAGRNGQREAQNTFSNFLTQADHVSRRSWELATRYPEYAQIHFQTFGAQTRAKAGASARENLDLNRDIGAQLRVGQIYESQRHIEMFLEKSLGNDGRLILQFRDLKGLAEESRDAVIQQVKDSSQELVKRFDEAEKERKEEAAKQAKFVEEERERAAHYETAKSSVVILSSTFSLFDPKVGQATAIVGNAAIQIADAIEKLMIAKKLGEAVSCVANMFANIAASVTSLIQLFMGGPDINQLILEAVQKLGQQVAQLREEMHDRFNRVDRSIEQLFIAIAEGFKELSSEVQDVRFNVVQLRHHVRNIEIKVAALQQSTRTYAAESMDETTGEAIDHCLSNSDIKTAKDFRECLSKFRYFATVTAARAVYAGSLTTIYARDTVVGLSQEDFFSKMGTALANGPWEQINPLLMIGATRYRVPVLPPDAGLPVNPEKWQSRAMDVMQLITSQWDAALDNKGVVTEEVRQVIRAGRVLSDNLPLFGTPKVKDPLKTELADVSIF